MSENFTSLSEYQPSSIPASGGFLLKKAREAEGISLESLATSLKVPISKLEALEADRLDLLPDIVFVRALVSSICRTLKIESSYILENFPNTNSRHLKIDEFSINTSFDRSVPSVDLILRKYLSKPVVLAVIALVIGSILIFFTPLKDLSKNNSSKSITNSASAVASTSEPKIIENLSPSIASISATMPELVSSKPKVTIVENPVFLPASVSLPSNNSSASLLAKQINSESIENTITIKARESSWIEIIDAKKVVQVRKNLVPGEVITASGVRPLSVVIGRADVIDVEVGGKPINLAATSKNNVARFEVK